MVTIMQLTDNLKSYISLQLESMAKTNPMIGFMKPLITRALDKNFSKVSKALDLIADKDGNIDIENILMDMFDSRGDRFSDRFNESGMGGNDMDRMMRYMKSSMRNSMSGEHFTESEAKYLVADMYHTENGRKYSGEKFDMHKAKEICERYRGILPTSVTVADVYVAINSQYHDYAELFKNWFGDGIEQKIVESAIVFWFKDADCKAENKVVEYLGEY